MMKERGRLKLYETCTEELHRGRLFHPQGKSFKTLIN